MAVAGLDVQVERAPSCAVDISRSPSMLPLISRSPGLEPSISKSPGLAPSISRAVSVAAYFSGWHSDADFRFVNEPVDVSHDWGHVSEADADGDTSDFGGLT